MRPGEVQLAAYRRIYPELKVDLAEYVISVLTDRELIPDQACPKTEGSE